MSDALRVVGLDHVVLRVRDLDAALRFWCGALGCREERRSDALGLVQLRAGRSLVDLVPVDSPLGRAGGPPPGPGRNVDHVALRIERFDAEALAAHLRAHGVEPGDVAERYGAEGTGPSMYVRDPDGNVVELKGPPGPAPAE
jgi:catechol 2,3-dioxygenase-like lactoylglutathione lyase family enzyme